MRSGFLHTSHPSIHQDQGPLLDERSSRLTWAEFANSRQPGGVVLDPPPQQSTSFYGGWGVPSTIHVPTNPSSNRNPQTVESEEPMVLDTPNNPLILDSSVPSTESIAPRVFRHPPAINTEGVPKNAFFEWCKQQQRLLYGKQFEVAKPTYITWKKGSAHQPLFRSVMVHPYTGECFESRRYGSEKYYHVEETTESGTLIWYRKKSYAEHGAAALAYDCLTLRETLAGGKQYLRLGHDAPYNEPRPLALGHIPDSEVKRIAIAKREAIQRGKVAEETVMWEKEAAWAPRPQQTTNKHHEAHPIAEQQAGEDPQSMSVETQIEKEAALLEHLASADKMIHYDHPAISKDSPISALNAFFQRTYKTNTGMKDFFITWDNGLKLPELRFTSIFVNPWSGEIFPSTRYEAVEDAIEDDSFTWFMEKVEARHAAAARAYECLTFREGLKSGETYESIGAHSPYLEGQLVIDETRIPVSIWKKVQDVVEVAKTSH